MPTSLFRQFNELWCFVACVFFSYSAAYIKHTQMYICIWAEKTSIFILHFMFSPVVPLLMLLCSSAWFSSAHPPPLWDSKVRDPLLTFWHVHDMFRVYRCTHHSLTCWTVWQDSDETGTRMPTYRILAQRDVFRSMSCLPDWNRINTTGIGSVLE